MILAYLAACLVFGAAGSLVIPLDGHGGSESTSPCGEVHWAVDFMDEKVVTSHSNPQQADWNLVTSLCCANFPV
jgi:hypothetical protein